MLTPTKSLLSGVSLAGVALGSGDVRAPRSTGGGVVRADAPPPGFALPGGS
jgi:hypothetical protein